MYILITLLKLWYVIRTRDTTNNLKSAIVTGLLNFINKEVLNDSNHTRYTIFRIAPHRSNYIIPWVRFLRGGIGGRKEAYASRARFQRQEGISGKVWNKPPGKLAIQLIPNIQTKDRNLRRLLYENTYGVRPDTFEAISDYMVNVSCIISYVCLDEHGQFLNLLSLDIDTPVRRVPIDESGAVYLEFQENGKSIKVDTQSLWRLVSTIGTVLIQYKYEQTQNERGLR